MKSLNQTNSSTNSLAVIKKLKFTLLSSSVIVYMILALMSLSITSCSKDDSPSEEEEIEEIVEVVQPKAELVSGSEDLTEGVIGAAGFGSLQHTVKATADEGFSLLIISRVVDGIKSEYQTIDTTHPNYVAGSNTFTYDLGYIFTEIDANKDIYFEAEVIDALNNSATLDFASATVKRSLKLVETLFMETRNPLQPDNMSIAQFMQIEGNQVGGVNLGTVINNDINDKVAAILSISEGEGIYLSSPSSVVHQESVDDITAKSATKFKKLSGEIDLNSYNIYDTFTIENIFDNANFGGHEERAAQINENDVYVMRTDDGRTAMFKITYFDVINGTDIYLTMDMYITQ